MSESHTVELTVNCAGIETAGVIIEIAGERKRQIEFYQFTPDHDDEHQSGGLAAAAACYANASVEDPRASPSWFPFDSTWWKPKDARRNLIKAAALIVAEIERLDRCEPDPDAVNEKIEPTLPEPHRSRSW